MDIRHLRSFVMVAQCLSFTEAAKRIFIGQSALSKHIAELEEEMGVELLIRHHRSLELTAAGKTLLRESVSLLDKVSDIIEKTRQADRGIRGHLKIGCFGGESAFLPQALKRFHSLYPQINIDLQILTLKMIENSLESEELDLGFVVNLGNELKPSKFKQHLIYKVPLCFLMPCQHAYARETSLDISALANESFILLSAVESLQGFEWFNTFCGKHGFSPSIPFTTTRMEGVLWLVEAGFGISFWSKNPTLTRCIHPGISLVDMQGEDAYSNIVAQWKKTSHNPAISLFLKMLETIDMSGAEGILLNNIVKSNEL
jgi:DNA-binding transcriptional LysR family regulator